MRMNGLEARQGDTAFAFLVLRLRWAVDRDTIIATIRTLGALIPDADAFIAELPEDADQTMRIVAMPWLPPDDEEGVATQRALLAEAGEVDEAWFFQTGTGLPAADEDAEDDEDIGWSNGPPPQISGVPFPVDGYPDIVEDLDWEDFGIAFK